MWEHSKLNASHIIYRKEQALSRLIFHAYVLFKKKIKKKKKEKKVDAKNRQYSEKW